MSLGSTSWVRMSRVGSRVRACSTQAPRCLVIVGGHGQSPTGSLQTAVKGQHVGRGTAIPAGTQPATKRRHIRGLALCVSNVVTADRSPDTSGCAALYLHGCSATPPWARTPCIQSGTLQQRVAQTACDKEHWCCWDWAGSGSGAPVLPRHSSSIPLVPGPPCAQQRCELPQATIPPLCHL